MSSDLCFKMFAELLWMLDYEYTYIIVIINKLYRIKLYFFRYVPPLRPVTSRWSLELPDSPSALEEELRKQESLLSLLHEQLLKGQDAKKEDELWEVQRGCTQLKRKVRYS